MGFGLTSWSLFLYLLIVCNLHVIQFAHGSGARELTIKHPEDQLLEHIRLYDSQRHPMNDPAKQDHVHGHPSSHMDHMDPSSMIFFFMEDLKVGKTMPIYFPKRDPSTSPRFLPREEADSIPFSLNQLPHLLEFFSFSPDSLQAKAIEDTLRHCESEPIKRETKLCATSLEFMFDFAGAVLGRYISTQFPSSNHFPPHKINHPFSELHHPENSWGDFSSQDGSMSYHALSYTIFYCHSQESENKVFKVTLGGENGDRVEVVAICHMDTSQWSPDHVSFLVLGVLPGTSTVCHFFFVDNLVRVPTPVSI